MKSNKIVYVCSECGYTNAKWLGRCPDCNSWNTLEEVAQIESTSKSAAQNKPIIQAEKLENMTLPEYIRIKTGLEELDRVLGGGLVSGSVVLISGEPGIGKSTLLLQVCNKLAQQNRVLYISGEESGGQIKLRAERLKINSGELYLLNETSMSAILSEYERIKPDVIMVDSIQTMYSDKINSFSGSVSQVRECAMSYIEVAKRTGCSIFLVGHVNKEGGISGPKILEHMVDAVLYFEGERRQSYRIIRAIKNRYGSTNEIGVFEMSDEGLVEVPNPSEMMMEARVESIGGNCAGCVIEGSRPIITEIQSLVAPTVYPAPKRTADGFDYNRMGLLLAVLERRLGLKFSQNDVYVNIAGGMRLDEPAADLAIAMALISGITDRIVPNDLIAFGEIGLSGEVRSVSHVEYRIKEAVRLGFKNILMPKKNISNRIKVPNDVKLCGVGTIYEALAYLKKKEALK
jgi:DNA repair protein RadA/Sms